MAEELLLINPRKRRAASPAQRAWRKKFGQMYGGGKHRRSYARNPIGAVAAVNPRHRKRKYRRNPVEALAAMNPRRRRRYHRNPRLGFSMQALTGQVMDGALGAIGGVGLDAVMRFVPATWKTGPARYLVKGAGSVLLGVVAGMLKLPAAGKIATGAMTVTLYEAAREYVTTPMGLGEYTESDIQALGYYSPGQILEGTEMYNQEVAGLGYREPVFAGNDFSEVGDYTDSDQ